MVDIDIPFMPFITRGGLPAVANGEGEWPGKAIIGFEHPVLYVEYFVDQQGGFGGGNVQAARQSIKLRNTMTCMQD